MNRTTHLTTAAIALLILGVGMTLSPASNDPALQAARGLLRRLLPACDTAFELEVIPAEAGRTTTAIFLTPT